MSVDQIDDQLSPAGRGVERRRQARHAGAAATQAVGEDLPRVVIVEGGSTDTTEELLLSVASGDREALGALKDRMGGLVRVNVGRVLRDASRADAVTQEFFAEVSRDAINFDPDRHSAQSLAADARTPPSDGRGSLRTRANTGPSSTPQRFCVDTSRD